MTPASDPHLALEPWFGAVLDTAQVKDGARVLLLEAFAPEQSRAILARIGQHGALTVLEPDQNRALAIDALDNPGLGVLAYRARGDEKLGMHDSSICCPPVSIGGRLDVLLSIATRNLRPGGRFVFDLPATEPCEALLAACAESGIEASVLSAMRGTGRADLESHTRTLGLRRCEVAELLHMVPFASPRDAALRVFELCGLDAADNELADSLARTLTTRLETIGEFELPFRRVRAVGMR